MGIEQVIRQQKFRNDYQKAMINLIYTHNWVMEKFKSHLDTYNLTNQQFNILRILRSAGKPLSTMQIRERMLDKMSDTSRIVDRLIAKDLVRKTVNDRDKRLVDVVITDKGLSLLTELDNSEDKMDGIFGNLTESEVRSLNQLLDKVRVEEMENQTVASILG
jgi:DNA-binding MarR family transcriptional regulator